MPRTRPIIRWREHSHSAGIRERDAPEYADPFQIAPAGRTRVPGRQRIWRAIGGVPQMRQLHQGVSKTDCILAMWV
jgi:hypothetical protein